MKNVFKRLVATALEVALIFTSFVFISSDGKSYATTGTLDLNVTYDENIVCGQETTFKLQGLNGSGNYKYMFNSVMLWDGDDGEWTLVIDPSVRKYGDANTYGFTFYTSGYYKLYFYVMDMTSYAYKRVTRDIEIDDEDNPSVETISNNVAQECIAKGFTTDFEKVAWLHDWVLDHISYDYSYTYCGAEGVLARGKGTCEAYHRAFEKLLNKVGFETERMTANGHVWTGVKMDGKWYNIDATWNDNGNYEKTNYERYLYWGLTDEQITTAHNEHVAHVGKECTSLENNYFIKTGWIKEWSDKYIAEIQMGLDNGKSSDTIACTEKTMPESYRKIMFPIVAYQLSSEEWELDEGLLFNATWKDDKLTYYACKVGDANKDGRTSAADLTAIAQHCARITTIEDDYTLKLSDTDSNSEVNISDATHLARYLARIISSL